MICVDLHLHCAAFHMFSPSVETQSPLRNALSFCVAVTLHFFLVIWKRKCCDDCYCDMCIVLLCKAKEAEWFAMDFED